MRHETRSRGGTGWLIVAATSSLVWMGVAREAPAQSGTLAVPFPHPSPNAALHYQRGLLFLNSIDAERKTLLKKPIWEVLPQTEEEEKELSVAVKLLLYQGRPAIEAAAAGSRLSMCDFGIDFSQHGSATMVPHTGPMLKLARLLTLRGAYAESKGKWEDAAVIYFDGLRIGRHLTQQRTLLEALAGIEVLENNYYALARWAVHCPKQPAVIRAFGLFESLAPNMVNPAQTVAYEASILRLQFDQLRKAYPDGPWADMILDGYEEKVDPHADQEARRKQAIAACEKRGVPKEAFKDHKSFVAYLDKLEDTALRYIEAAVTCMTLPPKARLERGRVIDQKYAQLLGPLGGDAELNPAEVGRLFAVHEAELAVARVSLAVAASKSKKGFPEKLDEVANRFGGKVPTSPYDGSALVYQVSNDRKSFSIGVGEVTSTVLTLPSVDFDSKPPAMASK